MIHQSEIHALQELGRQLMQQHHVSVIRRFQLFDLVHERWRMGGTDPATDMEVYRTKDGEYLGARHKGRRPGLVRYLALHGIRAELASPKHSVCSIGKADDGRWHGWSHRAVCSFGRGDRIFEERFGTDKTPFRKHGRRTVKTDADAKLAATRFAGSVS